MSEGLREKTKYSVEKPPLSIGEASERIAEIEQTIHHIEIQQGTKTEEGFPSEDDFRVWHRRSSDAIGHFSEERDFLNKWIAGAERAIRLERNDRGRRSLADMVTKTLFDFHFETYFSNSKTPIDTHEAHERIFYLKFIESKYSEVILHIRHEGYKLSMGERTIDDTIAPLVNRYKKVQLEIKLLNTYITQSKLIVNSAQSAGEVEIGVSTYIKKLREEMIGMSYSQIMCWLVAHIDPLTGRFVLKDDEEKNLFEKIILLVKFIEKRERN